MYTDMVHTPSRWDSSSTM